MSLTAINGRQKRHILADKREHSRSKAAGLKQHNVAESAKIGHNLAESTKSVNGFNRPVKRSEREASSENACLSEDLSGKFRLGSNPKTAKNALSARLFRESQTSQQSRHSRRDGSSLLLRWFDFPGSIELLDRRLPN